MSDADDEGAVTTGRTQRLAIGFGTLLILAMLFIAIAINAKNAADARRETQSWYVHSFEVLVATEAMKNAVNMSLRGERGYLITGDGAFLKPFEDGVREAPVAMARIAALTGGNEIQRPHVVELRKRTPEFFEMLRYAIAKRRAGDVAGADALVATGRGMREIDSLLAALDAIKAEEQRLLASRSAANEEGNQSIERHYYALAALGMLLLLVAAGVGISTARAQWRVKGITDQLRRSATIDELTGLHNRRCVMRELETEVALARRNRTPLSVAIVDLDFFKRVNDRHGHAGGDEVLRALARIFETTVRKGDVVGRLGGEEFAILMPDTDEMQARIVCERLRGATSGRTIRLASGAHVSITLSTGIALLRQGDDRDKLMRRADLALYTAKEGGRNQVRMAA